ncbi:MAG TPA: RNA polymerase sigma factor [Bacteroidales bacterium]|nr:RNA polymerase sigma factor [Bacteroidales bacterium]HPJ58456.1 RNA polymerase sigma factor [Bacteroidales bacterium]HPR11631.1 RNA polymerase sigma factor [Bacteroidales bacterium]HRW84992.1 RNA polymerase sigma factor [Bacteroidales bacterium]
MKGSYRQADDTELIKASVNGDRLAFSEIVERYRKMVARTVKGMLGDSVFSEDIGQEVFIKLYNSLSDFRGEAKLSTYIQKIAINLTLNEIKRRKRFFSMFSQDGDNELYEHEIPDPETEQKREAAEMVNKALAGLEPKFRIVVTMRMLQGYSTKETAEILDLPLGTVLSRLSRAQEQLKEILGKL